MARAHHEAPPAEEPKDMMSRFDVSDSQVETPPKKRARTAPPVPVEAYRPRKRKKEPISSEGKRSASVSGEISENVEHSLDVKESDVVASQEESPYEEMTVTEGPTASQQEAMNRESLRAETIELHDKFQDAQAEFESVADAVDRRAKEIAADLSGRNFPAETILVWSEAIQKREGLQEKLEAAMDKMIEARKAYLARYEAWEQSQRKDPAASAEMEKAIDAIVAEHQPASASFNAQEEAWFKKGEEEEAQQMEEARATIARGGKAESMIETPDEIEASVRQAEQMVASGELNGELFKTNDYRTLLVRKAQIDRDLETAGWGEARRLRAELKEFQRDLSDYEEQIQSVFRERADARDQARGLPSIPARKVQAREGSGTTVHKKGFFSRLFGGK